MKAWIIGVGFLLFLPPMLFAGDPLYLITDVEGQAALIPKGAAKAAPAVAKIPLKSGDRIVTAESARVEVSSKEGTVLEIKENSNIEVGALTTSLRSFKIYVGRLWGRFKTKIKKRRRAYRIHTPTSVAAVRGTDVALAVQENGDVHAGVIEGRMEMRPIEEAPEEIKQSWGLEPLVLEDFEGVIAKTGAVPIETQDLPPLVADSLDWFDHVRDRVPALREVFKNLNLRASENLRANALRQSINWTIPKELNPAFTSPEKIDVPRPSSDFESE